jgi:GT2 family glycosyltransferase
MIPKVALMTPTLEPEVAERACRLAMEHTEVPCVHYVVHDTEKVGGARSANVGLRWALEQNTPYICYINDDVDIEQHGWLERLIEVLDSNPRYCCTAPGGHCATAPQLRATKGMPKGYQAVKHLSHFCIVHKREALLDIGIFDEAFFHYGCDNDWNLRAAQKGWKLVWVRDVWIHHWGCNVQRRQDAWAKHDQALYKKRRGEGYYG